MHHRGGVVWLLARQPPLGVVGGTDFSKPTFSDSLYSLPVGPRNKMARLLVVLLTPPTALCLSGVFSTGGDEIAVQPVKLLRLLNSVYASDNLLLFGREEE